MFNTQQVLTFLNYEFFPQQRSLLISRAQHRQLPAPPLTRGLGRSEQRVPLEQVPLLNLPSPTHLEQTTDWVSQDMHPK